MYAQHVILLDILPESLGPRPHTWVGGHVCLCEHRAPCVIRQFSIEDMSFLYRASIDPQPISAADLWPASFVQPVFALHCASGRAHVRESPIEPVRVQARTG